VKTLRKEFVRYLSLQAQTVAFFPFWIDLRAKQVAKTAPILIVDRSHAAQYSQKRSLVSTAEP
jgi:hypothetical protein